MKEIRFIDPKLEEDDMKLMQDLYEDIQKDVKLTIIVDHFYSDQLIQGSILFAISAPLSKFGLENAFKIPGLIIMIDVCGTELESIGGWIGMAIHRYEKNERKFFRDQLSKSITSISCMRYQKYIPNVYMYFSNE